MLVRIEMERHPLQMPGLHIYANTAQQQCSQRWNDVFKPLWIACDNPASNNLVDGTEPGKGGDPGINRGNSSFVNSLVQVFLNHPRELRAYLHQFFLEAMPQANGLNEQYLAQAAVARKGIKYGTQRGINPGNRVSLLRNGSLGSADQARRQCFHQCQEDALFIGEMEIEAAFGHIGSTHDIIDYRPVIALFGKDLFRGL